jgi:hypothetical protein
MSSFGLAKSPKKRRQKARHESAPWAGFPGVFDQVVAVRASRSWRRQAACPGGSKLDDAAAACFAAVSRARNVLFTCAKFCSSVGWLQIVAFPYGFNLKPCKIGCR